MMSRFAEFEVRRSKAYPWRWEIVKHDLDGVTHDACRIRFWTRLNAMRVASDLMRQERAGWYRGLDQRTIKVSASAGAGGGRLFSVYPAGTVNEPLPERSNRVHFTGVAPYSEGGDPNGPTGGCNGR